MLESLAAAAVAVLGLERGASGVSAVEITLRTVAVYRAINGSASFFPTLAAGTGLVALHWLFAVLAFHTDWLGSLVKGRRILRIKDGHVEHEGMRRASLSTRDLEQALREQTGQRDPARVERAYLERSGKIRHA